MKGSLLDLTGRATSHRESIPRKNSFMSLKSQELFTPIRARAQIGASKKGATAPFKLGGHPVQRLIRKRKRGNGQQHLVLWGDGTENWAPARDIEKEPELIRAFEKSL